jgi:LPS sulfotransferase NodH
MSHVAMFHIGRSGSTVLGELLGQHPEVHWDGEVHRQAVRALKRGRKRGSLKTHDPIGALATRIAASPKPVYGFEVKFFHLRVLGVTLTRYLDALQGINVTRFIVLRRRNTLRKVVSSLVAQQTGAYRVPAGSRPSRKKVEVNVERLVIDADAKPLLAFLEDYERAFDGIEKRLADRQSLTLVYEDDILLDPVSGYRSVCAFLGLAPAEAQVKAGRNNPFPLDQIVSNIDQVRSALAGTPFAWMAQDGA